MKRIEQLPLDALAAGMTLAEDVFDESGRLLIPAGAVLTESTIGSLERRDIGSVMVVLEVIEDPSETEAYRQRVCKDLDQLFRHAGHGEETRMLYQTVLAYRMEHRP